MNKNPTTARLRAEPNLFLISCQAKAWSIPCFSGLCGLRKFYNGSYSLWGSQNRTGQCDSVKNFTYTILLNHQDMPIRELLLFSFYRLHEIISQNCKASIEAQAYKPRYYRALRCLIIATWRFIFSGFGGLYYVTYIKQFSTKELKCIEQRETKRSFLKLREFGDLKSDDKFQNCIS